MTAGTVAMLARWLLRIFVSLGVLGAVRKFRAFFDYLDFVSACQLNMDAGSNWTASSKL